MSTIEHLPFVMVFSPYILQEDFLFFNSSTTSEHISIVVSGVVKLLSAAHAGKLAQINIADGKFQFEPKLILPTFDSSEERVLNQGGVGLGMGIGL